MDILRLSTSISVNHIARDGWPAYCGVVEKLAALHASWKLAVITDAQTEKVGAISGIAWLTGGCGHARKGIN